MYEGTLGSIIPLRVCSVTFMNALQQTARQTQPSLLQKCGLEQ